MSTFRLSLVCISTALALFIAPSLSAQPVKTPAPLSIRGDLELGGSGIVFPDGSVQPSAGVTYARTVVVSPAGTPAQSGDALRLALSAITDVAESSPALLKIEPGVYDLGSQPLQMKAWVDIEGSGQRVTLLKGRVDNLEAGVIMGASYAELRWLGVENTGPGTNCAAIFNKGCAPRIFRVTARASGGSYNSAIYNKLDGNPLISQVVVEAFGAATVNAGVYNTESYPRMSAVDARAADGNYNYGIYNHGGEAQLTKVSASAEGGQMVFGVYGNQTFLTMTAVDASAYGAAKSNYGIFLFDLVGRIQDTRVEVSSAPENYGVYMTSSSPEVSGLSVEVRGALGETNQNYGIYIIEASEPKLSQVQVAVRGGAGNRAVFSQSSSLELDYVAAVASDADSYGIYLADGGGSLKAHHSVFHGDTKALYNGSGKAAEFGACKLDGAIEGPGKCAGCYNDGFTPIDGTCH